MAAVVGAVKSLSTLTPDEGSELLGFDSSILMLQARLPVLLAALALLRDTFGDTGTKCYPPEYVSNAESVKYFNAYCTYQENDDLIGYHEFVPFSFTLQAVLLQIPALGWIACGGRKISSVARWFARCCREMCSEAEAPHNLTKKNADTSNETDWPKVYSIMQCYIDEWSTSSSYVSAYFAFKLFLCAGTCASLTYHYLLLIVTIHPDFLNHEFNCDVQHLNVTVNCVKPYEIFNQILVIINIVLCLGIPLVMFTIRDAYLFIAMYYGWQNSMSEFIPFLKIPVREKRLNNTKLLVLYYKEIVGLDEKYVQKILIPWKLSKSKPDEIAVNELCATASTSL